MGEMKEKLALFCCRQWMANVLRLSKFLEDSKKQKFSDCTFYKLNSFLNVNTEHSVSINCSTQQYLNSRLFRITFWCLREKILFFLWMCLVVLVARKFGLKQNTSRSAKKEKVDFKFAKTMMLEMNPLNSPSCDTYCKKLLAPKIASLYKFGFCN